MGEPYDVNYISIKLLKIKNKKCKKRLLKTSQGPCPRLGACHGSQEGRWALPPTTTCLALPSERTWGLRKARCSLFLSGLSRQTPGWGAAVTVKKALGANSSALRGVHAG